VALLPLLVALGRVPRGFERPRPFRTFLLGWITGITYFWGTLYWLIDVMVTFGGLATPLAIVLAGLLILYLALFPAAFAVIVGYARRQIGVGALLIAPAVWTATELARGYLLTGFPWVPLGNSQVTVLPIAQFASVIGVFGLSALVAAPAAAVAYAIHYGSDTSYLARSRSRSSERLARFAALGVVSVLIAGVALWGQARVGAGELLRQGTPMKVGIVQGNIQQQVKWKAEWRERILSSYLDMSYKVAGQGVSMIVWPEASMPFLFEEDPKRAEMVRRLARDTGTYLLLGGDQVERRRTPDTKDRWFNSAFLLRPDGGVAGTYKKMQLVPFGEYVPFAHIFTFAGPIIEAVDNFSAGERVELLRFNGGTVAIGEHAAPVLSAPAPSGTNGSHSPTGSNQFGSNQSGSNPIASTPPAGASGTSDDNHANGPLASVAVTTGICYEAVFPHLAREAVQAGSQLLTTITNDAWYGTSSAPFQHFEQASMRAIEQGRYLVRSANTGISGVVDPYGRAIVRSELFVPATLTAEVRLLMPWTLYARIGDAFAYACLALTVLTLIASLRAQPYRVSRV
jgi:apolipoprotein N-acyltransferase